MHFWTLPYNFSGNSLSLKRHSLRNVRPYCHEFSVVIFLSPLSEVILKLLNPYIVCISNEKKITILGISRVVASALSPPRKSQKMVVVIYGGKGWIGQQCCKKLLERKIHFTLANCRIGKNSYEEVRSAENCLI